MILTTAKRQEILTFEQFIKQLPDKEGRYEFVNGEIVRILPIRLYERIAESISDHLKDEVKQHKLNCWVRNVES